jgi:hypothetical protein
MAAFIIRLIWRPMAFCQIKEVIYHCKEVVITGEFKLVRSGIKLN